MKDRESLLAEARRISAWRSTTSTAGSKRGRNDRRMGFLDADNRGGRAAYRKRLVCVGAMRAAIVVALLLGACADGNPWDWPTSENGEPWPIMCSHDLAAETAHVPITYAPRNTLNQRVGFRFGSKTDVNGIYNSALKSITLADDLRGHKLADVMHYERCRYVVHIATGLPYIAAYDFGRAPSSRRGAERNMMPGGRNWP